MNSRNYKFVTLAVLVFLFFNFKATAQVGIGTTIPNANAMLDVEASDKGFLPPRLDDVEKTALGAALLTAGDGVGMLVFDTTLGAYSFWDGAAWVAIGGAPVATTSSLGNLYFNPTPASETLATGGGPFTSPTVAANLQDFTMPAANQLQYDGTDTKVFTIHMTLTFIRNTNSALTDLIQFYVAKNGAAITGVGTVVIAPPVQDPNETKTVTILGTVSLSTNDIVGVYAGSPFGSTISVTNMNLVLSE